MGFFLVLLGLSPILVASIGDDCANDPECRGIPVVCVGDNQYCDVDSWQDALARPCGDDTDQQRSACYVCDASENRRCVNHQCVKKEAKLEERCCSGSGDDSCCSPGKPNAEECWMPAYCEHPLICNVNKTCAEPDLQTILLEFDADCDSTSTTELCAGNLGCSGSKCKYNMTADFDCIADVDCPYGKFCKKAKETTDANFDSTEGTCTDSAHSIAPGSPCSRSTDDMDCGHDQVCEWTFQGVKNSGGVCVSPLSRDIGQSCFADNNLCKPGLYCNSGVCDEPSTCDSCASRSLTKDCPKAFGQKRPGFTPAEGSEKMCFSEAANSVRLYKWNSDQEFSRNWYNCLKTNSVQLDSKQSKKAYDAGCLDDSRVVGHPNVQKKGEQLGRSCNDMSIRMGMEYSAAPATAPQVIVLLAGFLFQARIWF